MLFEPSSILTPRGHFVGGVGLASGESFDVVSASDPQITRPLNCADDVLVDRAVTAAKTAFRSSQWATVDPRSRARTLKRWSVLIRDRAEELACLEALISTRPYPEVLARDVHVAADCIEFFAEFADKLDGAVTPTSGDVLSLSVYEPHGVVAAISPWNFPLILSAWKYAPALAAGNAVVLKPSELAPFSLTKIAELAIEAGVPPGIFNVVHGDGKTGAALVKHPDVDYVSFTGSVETGAQVAADAALSGVKPVSLELGGKGAQLVFSDAPNKDALISLLKKGACYNSGQVCFAGTRLVVEEAVADEVIAGLAAAFQAMRPGATWNEHGDLPPIINEKQLHRIHSIVCDSVAQGAEIITGGTPLEGPRGAAFYAPTILRNVSDETPAVAREIFGPVLTVQTFSDFDEAIQLVNHKDFALANSVHTSNMANALRAARRMEVGTVWVNDWGRKGDLTSPFGGYKKSGYGKDLGRPGFEKYLKSKSIWFDVLVN